MAPERRIQPFGSWSRTLQLAFAGVACGSIAVLLFEGMLLVVDLPPLAVAAILTLAISVPLCLLALFQNEKIQSLNGQLEIAATQDSLTGSLKAPAFASLVDRRTSAQAGNKRQGAMLIVEASHARALHRRFGQGWDEEPMQLIADAIRKAIRTDDLVGRLDIHTFGIFLPTATEKDAKAIGERIRKKVAAVYVAPRGFEDGFTISIGGVVCEDMVDFDTMYRAASEVFETTPEIAATGVGLKSLHASA